MSDPKRRLNDATPDEWNKAHANWVDKTKPTDNHDTNRDRQLNYEKPQADTTWDNWRPARDFG